MHILEICRLSICVTMHIREICVLGNVVTMHILRICISANHLTMHITIVDIKNSHPECYYVGVVLSLRKSHILHELRHHVFRVSVLIKPKI